MECLRDNFSNGVFLGDRYQTISPLNHGSFGMVFMARDLHTDDTVAIKCLTKRAAASEAGFDLAIDEKSEELVLHRRLGSHPNIVNLMDSFETDAHVYLVMEFCERGDLYEAIRVGHGPLETEHVRRFMLELVDAVDYIHSRGVYHRDIKPENLFLSQSGEMKLGDFGLATTERWTFETTVGSDRYMSPEQYDSAGAGYSPAQADIWAIGICLLNILFSRNPFTVPAESDPLFLDFIRDKQSLFDVFPSMSQDTYEVIVQCMNMDPKKRSLEGTRDALLRVVSFTTEDEALDDFCSADRHVISSSNREPFRTPSLQSPYVDTGAFPWAKALHASPRKNSRRLSIIPDEGCSEDLFSKSGASAGWLSGTTRTPSMSSIVCSSLGASFQSLAVEQAVAPVNNAKRILTLAGSLPITMTKSRVPSLSSVLGRKDAVSKSWSDMWDEDTEEEQTRALQQRQEMNARTWSHESKPALAEYDSDDTPRLGLSPVVKSATVASGDDTSSIDATVSSRDIDEDLADDGFFFQEVDRIKDELVPSPISPITPSKRSDVDKWAALGERRRAFTDELTPKTPEVTVRTGRQGSCTGLGLTLLGGSGTSDLLGHSQLHVTPFSSHQSLAKQHGNGKWSFNHTPKDRIKECPHSKGRNRNWNFDWRKEKRHAFGGLEWVGGWQEARS